MTLKARCECSSAEVRPCPELPCVLVCQTCGGWFAVRLYEAADVDKFKELFHVRPGEGFK